MTRSLNCVMLRRIVYDKPGTYEFQPAHYPGTKYIRADVRQGRVSLELWGHKEDAPWARTWPERGSVWTWIRSRVQTWWTRS